MTSRFGQIRENCFLFLLRYGNDQYINHFLNVKRLRIFWSHVQNLNCASARAKIAYCLEKQTKKYSIFYLNSRYDIIIIFLFFALFQSLKIIFNTFIESRSSHFEALGNMLANKFKQDKVMSRILQHQAKDEAEEQVELKEVAEMDKVNTGNANV